MEINGKTITLDASLWAQYDNVSVSTTGGKVILQGRDEESYLKIFNHFGRVLILLVFEDGQWVEAGSGRAVQHVDLSQAGYVAGPGPSVGQAKARKSPSRVKTQPARRNVGAGNKTKAGSSTTAKGATATSSGNAKTKAKAAAAGKAGPKRAADGKPKAAASKRRAKP